MASEIIVQTIKAPTSGANANKVIIPSGVTLDASAGTLTPSAGQVIQTVKNRNGTSITNATTSLVNMNLGISFTPKFSNSEIIFSGHVGLGASTQSSNVGIGVALYKDGSQVTDATNYMGISYNANKFIIFYHDSSHARDFYGQMPFQISATGQLTAGTTYAFDLYFRGWINSGAGESQSVNSSGYTNSYFQIQEIAR